MSSPNTSSAMQRPSPELRAALWAPMPLYMQAARHSLLIGVLMLAPSWFMFEVYGRVLNSRNTATLAWLVIAAVGLYVVLELLEIARSRVLYAAASLVEKRLTPRVFNASFTANLHRPMGGYSQGMADLRTLSDFIPSTAVTAVLDFPASLLCLVLLSVMSPWLGVLALLAAGVQTAIGAYQERQSARPYGEANAAAVEAQQRAAGILRNAQVIESMGMEARMHERWTKSQSRFLIGLSRASDKAGVASAASRMVVTLQGSLLLGLAAWLGVNNMLLGGPGEAIVASILGGRVLAPLAQLIGQWRAIGGVRTSFARLSQLLNVVPEAEPGMELPKPKGVMRAENLIVAPPGVNAPVLKGVTLMAQPGEILAVIGASASGKSTLARALVGVWPSAGGKVRLDGADIYTWHKSQLGPHVGYVPQGVELFDGTVAENIARFGKVDLDKVRAAADRVGITAMLDELPDGFDTQIGDGGAVLSGGQRQRIAIARAIYDSPRYLVLDEPNSSLDDAGDKALLATLNGLRQAGCTIIVITHRVSLLGLSDKVLLMAEGQVVKYGPRDEVLNAMRQAATAVATKAAGANPPAVPATAAVAAAPGGAA